MLIASVGRPEVPKQQKELKLQVEDFFRSLLIPCCRQHLVPAELNFISNLELSSIQSLSRVWLFATPWTATRQTSLSITNSQSLLKLTSMESVMPSNHLILCRPLLILLNEGRKGLGWHVWSSCSPKDSQESSPIPQFKSINSLAFSFLYSPSLTSIHDHWKNIALTRGTFVDKVMSLLFNMLSRLIITFLPRSKRLLISWLQSPSAVILEPQKIKTKINT